MSSAQMEILNPSTKPTMKYYVILGLFSSSVALFYISRLPEIISMITTNQMHALMVGAGVIALATMFAMPPATASLLVRRLGLVFMVLYQLKQEMDVSLVKRYAFDGRLENLIVVVTGANSGTGYAISELLYHRGATVVMSCRNQNRCQNAAKAIELSATVRGSTADPVGRLDVKILDLADLNSVRSFADDIKRSYKRIDVLVNNAGLASKMGEKTVQGLEMSFGAMHVGHFALTNWLLPLLSNPIQQTDAESVPVPAPPLESARIVNIGSQAYVSGKFHESLFDNAGDGDLQGEITDNCPTTGPFGAIPCCPVLLCPITNGYARAKLANLLHAQELQRIVDERAEEMVKIFNEPPPRRVVTATVHPGSVATNILGSGIANSELASVFLRTPTQAAHIILHAIVSDRFVPGAYIDATGRAHDLAGFAMGGQMERHLSSYPNARSLYFARPAVFKLASFDQWAFRNIQFVSYVNTSAARTVNTTELAAKLWEVSDRIVKNFEQQRPILSL